jgi:hypothetical protein
MLLLVASCICIIHASKLSFSILQRVNEICSL